MALAAIIGGIVGILRRSSGEDPWAAGAAGAVVGFFIGLAPFAMAGLFA